MTTQETIQHYFSEIQKGNWESFSADDMKFVGPRGEEKGKEAYVTATKRFLQNVTSVEIMHMVVDGKSASVFARYAVISPQGNKGVCDVAEHIQIIDGKLSFNAIIFDQSAFRNFMQS